MRIRGPLERKRCSPVQICLFYLLLPDTCTTILTGNVFYAEHTHKPCTALFQADHHVVYKMYDTPDQENPLQHALTPTFNPTLPTARGSRQRNLPSRMYIIRAVKILYIFPPRDLFPGEPPVVPQKKQIPKKAFALANPHVSLKDIT